MSAQTSVTYTYDDVAVNNSKGRLTQAAYQNSGTTKFSYDSLGRETQSVKKVDSVDYTVSRAYDAANRLTNLTNPDNSQISYTYNPVGQIEGVSSGINVYVSSVDYLASGQIAKIVYGNGVNTVYTYDPNTLRLAHLVTKDGANHILQDLSYSFDEVGNVLAITDNLNSASQTFSYDALNRLVGASGTYYGSKIYAYDAIGNITLKDGITFNYGEGAAGPHALTSASDGSAFSYDANGNMVSLVKDGVTTGYQYDLENRLIKVAKAGNDLASFDYDGDGGRVKKTAYSFQTVTRYKCPPKGTLPPKKTSYLPDEKLLRYVFEFRSSFMELAKSDNFNADTRRLHARLPSVGQADGRRLEGNEIRGNLRLIGENLRSEFNNLFGEKEAEAGEEPMQLALVNGCKPYTTTVAVSTPTIYVGSLYEKSNNLTTKHIFLGSQRIATINGGAINYYHPDHLGSSNIITDQFGTALQHLEYDPYGAIALSEGQNKVDYKFTGKELDEETGLYYYGARYYNPLIGRFITPDTIVQSPGNPQTLNRYSYCGNNPVSYIDPSGQWFFAAIFAIVKAVAAAAVAHPVIAGVVVGGLQGGITAAVQGQNIFQGIGVGMLGGGMAGFGGMNMVIGASVSTGFLSTEPGQQLVSWSAHYIFDNVLGMRPRAAYFWSYLVTDAMLTAGVSYGLESMSNPVKSEVRKLTSEEKAGLKDIQAKIKSGEIDPKAITRNNGGNLFEMPENSWRALTVKEEVKAFIAREPIFGIPFMPFQHTTAYVPGVGNMSFKGLDYLFNSGVCHQSVIRGLEAGGIQGLTPLNISWHPSVWLSYGVYGREGQMGATLDNFSKAAYYSQSEDR